MTRRTLVLDASAAVHLATMGVPWPGLERFDFHAPPLMWSEALSGLSQAAHRGDMPHVALSAAVERMEALPVTTADAGVEHRRAALDIARQLGWAKTYDAEYVALARTLDCSILTTDQRLQRGAKRLIDIVGPADLAE